MKIQNFGKPLSRLIIMVAICMLSLHAMAYDFSYTHQETTLYYTITSSNTVKVAYYYSVSVSGYVVIPSSVTNNGTTYSVTSIGDRAFGGCSGLTSVTIPNSVTSIGDRAFGGCSGLTSVTIPNSVTSIGEWAFYECSGLTSVTIPNSVTSIGECAFQNCSRLNTLNFNAVNCNDFSYSYYPFDYCPISTINLGDSVQRIPANFANGRSSLTSVTIPNSVTSIGDRAFSGCSGLTSVTIGNSVTSIGNYAFASCSGLTSVTIPNSLTSIGGSAFQYCSSLTSITIPNSVTSIGGSAFQYCSGLTSVTIPNSVTSIGDYAFRSCSGLTSVTIPNSVTSTGNYAFYECSSLTSVTIPNSVTSIGECAFYKCSGLTSVTIPESVNSIGKYAFYKCSGLTSVTIPESVNSIGNFAFDSCSSLTTLNFNAINCSDFAYYHYYAFGLDRVDIYPPFYGCPIATINIGDNVQRIPKNFASDLRSLSIVAIPNSVTSIGDSAFFRCSGLTSITIPNSVTSIGNYAFRNCSGLTSVTIPNSVTSIGNYAFYECSGLTSVTIPNSVTSIGEGAFYACNGLTSIVSNAVVPPVIGNYVFLNSNNCNVTVPCGSLLAYIASSWYNYFPNRITEGLSFDLSVAANDDSFGSVSVETLSCNVRTLTATPSSCKSFVAWNDGNNNNPRIVAITSDTSFTAIFESVEISNDITASICQGSAYTENGFNVSEAGVYTQNLQTINGCDSVVTLTLTVNPVATTNLNAAICEGTTYTENGFNVSEAGIYTQNLQTINGCDSIVTLTLTVNPVATTALQASICEGTTYTENGFNVSEAGVYTQNLQTINGCDSTVTLTLIVNPVATTALQAAICQGETYTENGFNVSEAGVYTQNLQTINGCDSTVTLTLTVNPIATTALQAAICEGTTYTDNGFNVSEAGVYTQNLQTINGCDSTVTLTLTVNPVATTALQAAICEGTAYTENGFNISEAGVYTQNLQTINGCDSIVTLTLTVNPVATTALQAAICQGETYTENGFNVSEAGVYTQNLQTINGCDSVVTLTLTVNPVATTALQAAICEGTAYTDNGFNVSEAGVYTQNLQTINGCDSVVTLTLTVNPVATTALQAAICEGTAYTDNGFNVSEAGVYTQNLQTINGCDSTVTLTLTVNPVATTALQASICEGTAYTENGFNISEAGVYTQNLQTINGCDSVVTLTLTVNPVATTALQAAICEGTAYTDNGFNVSEAGVYTQNLQTINGCDSVVTLTLTVNPVYSFTIDATINQGETYHGNGFEVSEAGTYTQNLQTVNGCDSVIVLELTINSSLGDVVANTIEVALYPNPAENYTVLKVQGLKEQTKVALFDVRGRKLREFDLSAGTESVRLDLRDLPSGVYTLMIGNTTKKLIVE